jgi:coenzyme F420-reducing hydrogenase delta subunit/Pyruvate/2-oxoacid:ferredoxin oxidoreductase delta subunit
MTTLAERSERGVGAVLRRVDAGFERVYGSRWNPMHHTGSITVLLLLVLLVTGIYLLLLYRVGAPYESMERITAQAWGGRWIRSLHRFAADAAMVTIALHALRMFAQSRSWGPRALAWFTGTVLILVMLICGWTGYVMVWDVQAQLLAVEGARLMDVLPILSEPVSRTFTGESVVPSVFFFMNLFLHVALPIGLGILVWMHVARLPRPKLLPPRRVSYGVTGVLIALAVLWPVGMAPEADLLRVPEPADFDWFYGFWLPLSARLPAGVVWLLASVLGLALLSVPLLVRRRDAAKPLPSVVNERLCTGCEQCANDCPYHAITMVERTDGRPTLVARVDVDLCVSCGICAGSCAPMVVGPPGRSGRDQVAGARELLDAQPPAAGEVAVIGCLRGPGAALQGLPGTRLIPVACVGSVHTSQVELLVRGGFAGVMVVGCPPDDCRNREGAKWAEQRLFHGREAELQERVDRRRVRLTHATRSDAGRLASELEAFRASLPVAEWEDGELDLLRMCERADEEVAL